MSRQPFNSALNRKSFIIPACTNISDIKTGLYKNFHCAESPVRSLQRTFLDTFDWRIYRAGGAMEVQSGAGFSTLNWRDLKSDAILDSTSSNKDICFARDMPPGSLRKRIEPLLEMRALLPLVHTRGKVHRLNVLNKDEKTVVHLMIEENHLSATSTSAQNKIPVTLSVELVKGYSETFQQVLHFIEQQFSLQPDKQTMALRVYEAAGLQPGDYSSSLDLKLTAEMRADAAARIVLLRLFETMQANENGLKADWDSEFLHDYRVAVCRTRSLLGQIKGVCAEKVLKSQDFKTMLY